MSLRTLFRRTAVPVVAVVAISGLAAAPAQAAVGTPSKPVVTQAAVNSPGFVVSYSKVSGATGYKIQWSTSSKFTSAKSLSTSLTKKTITGLAQGKLYYVRVIARKGTVYGKWSAATSRTRAKNWIAKTWNVTPTVDKRNDKLVVRWNRPDSATTDAVYYRVTVADNRDMNKTDPPAPRSVYYRQITTAKTATKTPYQSISTGLPVSSTGIGAQFFFNFEVKNYDGSWKPATNISKAATRYSNGLLPADPAADALSITPTCDGLVARWKPGQSPVNSRGLEVEYYDVASPETVLTKRSDRNRPTESINISGLSEGVQYAVRARPVNGSQESAGWTNPASAFVQYCATPINVGSYNVVADNVATSYIPAWSTRAAAVQETIDDNADLVGVQESRTSGGSTQTSDLTPAGWDRADSGTGGTHIVYRKSMFDVVAQRSLSTSAPSVAKPAVDNAVGAVFEQKTNANKKFIVINLHANVTNTPGGWANEVTETKGLVQTLKNDAGLLGDIPVVFLGDVNLSRSEFRDTLVRQALGTTFTDSQLWSPGTPLTNFNSTNKLQQCGHAGELGLNVDGIFSAFGAAAVGWKMVGTDGGSDCLTAAPKSDHNMIVATFQLPI